MTDRYVTPQNQELPWHTVVFKRDGTWVKYHSTYHPELAQSWYGALTNDSAFTNEGVKIIETKDQEVYLTEALAALNGA